MWAPSQGQRRVGSSQEAPRGGKTTRWVLLTLSLGKSTAVQGKLHSGPSPASTLVPAAWVSGTALSLCLRVWTGDTCTP